MRYFNHFSSTIIITLQCLYQRVLKSNVQIFSFLTTQICGYGCWMWSLWLTLDFKDQLWFQVRHDLGFKRINKYNICTIHWIENKKSRLINDFSSICSNPASIFKRLNVPFFRLNVHNFSSRYSKIYSKFSKVASNSTQVCPQIFT